MVDQVRSLRQACVQAVLISCSPRVGSIVDKEFFATEENLISAGVIFSSPKALALTKWREALENPLVSSRVCVQWLVMKPTACQYGQSNSISLYSNRMKRQKTKQ